MSNQVLWQSDEFIVQPTAILKCVQEEDNSPLTDCHNVLMNLPFIDHGLPFSISDGPVWEKVL